MIKKVIINKFITLKLIGNNTEIFVSNVWFRQCKSLLINIPPRDMEIYDEIKSIDEAADIYNKHGGYHQIFEISPEEEFWGHCSNIETWVECNYDTDILHSNLSFPLLRALVDAGDIKAKQRFKDEIAKKFSYNYDPVIRFLASEGYLEYLSEEECVSLINTYYDNANAFNIEIMLNNFGRKSKASKILKRIYIEDVIEQRQSLNMNDLFPYEILHYLVVDTPSDYLYRFKIDLAKQLINDELNCYMGFKIFQRFIESNDIEAYNICRDRIFHCFQFGTPKTRNYCLSFLDLLKKNDFLKLIQIAPNVLVYKRITLYHKSKIFNKLVEDYNHRASEGEMSDGFKEIIQNKLIPMIKKALNMSELHWRERYEGRFIPWINISKYYANNNDLELALDANLKAIKSINYMWRSWAHYGSLFNRQKRYIKALICQIQAISHKGIEYDNSQLFRVLILFKMLRKRVFPQIISISLDDLNLEIVSRNIKNLPCLKKLFLQNNKLKSIPETLGGLKRLESLYLFKNLLTELPSLICNLVNLKVIDLGFNNIKTLPKQIGNLKSLEVLMLTNNKIHELPIGIDRLQSLKILALGSNHIHNIPKDLMNLSSLETVYLIDNPISSENKTITALREKGVKVYLTEEIEDNVFEPTPIGMLF